MGADASLNSLSYRGSIAIAHIEPHSGQLAQFPIFEECQPAAQTSFSRICRSATYHCIKIEEDAKIASTTHTTNPQNSCINICCRINHKTINMGLYMGNQPLGLLPAKAISHLALRASRGQPLLSQEDSPINSREDSIEHIVIPCLRDNPSP